MNYVAPEIILPYDEKIDIWSFGCVLYELATGKLPFQFNSLK
jgi:serine/threonine protein kinase